LALPITSKVPVAIGRGENSGRTLTYTNVVRRWVKLGDWDGNAASFSVPWPACPTPIIRSRISTMSR